MIFASPCVQFSLREHLDSGYPFRNCRVGQSSPPFSILPAPLSTWHPRSNSIAHSLPSSQVRTSAPCMHIGRLPRRARRLPEPVHGSEESAPPPRPRFCRAAAGRCLQLPRPFATVVQVPPPEPATLRFPSQRAVPTTHSVPRVQNESRRTHQQIDRACRSFNPLTFVVCAVIVKRTTVISGTSMTPLPRHAPTWIKQPRTQRTAPIFF